MRCLAFAAVLVGFSCWSTTAGDEPAPKSVIDRKEKTDAELFQGAWAITGLETGGKIEPEKNYRGNTFTFAKDKATLREGLFAPVEFTFTIDPTKSPRTIDLTAKNAVVRGIYKFEGDSLILCLSIGPNRPTEFVTRPGGESELFTMKRSPWERYTDRTFGYSVDLPGKPEERKRDTSVASGKVVTTMQVVRSEMERVTYFVAVTPLPRAFEGKATEAVMEAMRHAVVAEVDKNATAAVESETNFKAGGHTGKELTLALESSESKGILRARVFVTSERVYGLFTAGGEDSVKAANVGRFWISFRAAGDKKKN